MASSSPPHEDNFPARSPSLVLSPSPAPSPSPSIATPQEIDHLQNKSPSTPPKKKRGRLTRGLRPEPTEEAPQSDPEPTEKQIADLEKAERRARLQNLADEMARKKQAAPKKPPAYKPVQKGVNPFVQAEADKVWEKGRAKREQEEREIDEYNAAQAAKKAIADKEEQDAIRAEDEELRISDRKAKLEKILGAIGEAKGLDAALQGLQNQYEHGGLTDYIGHPEKPRLNVFKVIYRVGKGARCMKHVEVPLPEWKAPTSASDEVDEGGEDAADLDPLTYDDFLKESGPTASTGDLEDDEAEALTSIHESLLRPPVIWSQLTDAVKYTIFEELRKTRKDEAAFADLGLTYEEQDEYYDLHISERERLAEEDKVTEEYENALYNLRRANGQTYGLNGEEPLPAHLQGIATAEEMLELIDEHTYDGPPAINSFMTRAEITDGMTFLDSLFLPSEWLTGRIGQITYLKPGEAGDPPAFGETYPEDDDDNRLPEPEAKEFEDMDTDNMTIEQRIARLNAAPELDPNLLENHQQVIYGDEDDDRWAPKIPDPRIYTPDPPPKQDKKGKKKAKVPEPAARQSTLPPLRADTRGSADTRPRQSSRLRHQVYWNETSPDPEVQLSHSPNPSTPSSSARKQQGGSGGSGIKLRLGRRTASVENSPTEKRGNQQNFSSPPIPNPFVSSGQGQRTAGSGDRVDAFSNELFDALAPLTRQTRRGNAHSRDFDRSAELPGQQGDSVHTPSAGRKNTRAEQVASPHNAGDYWSFSSPASQGLMSPGFGIGNTMSPSGRFTGGSASGSNLGHTNTMNPSAFHTSSGGESSHPFHTQAAQSFDPSNLYNIPFIKFSIASFLEFINTKLLQLATKPQTPENIASHITFQKWAIFLGLLKPGNPVLSQDYASNTNILVEWDLEFCFKVAGFFEKVRPDRNEVMDIQAMKSLNRVMKDVTSGKEDPEFMIVRLATEEDVAEMQGNQVRGADGMEGVNQLVDDAGRTTTEQGTSDDAGRTTTEQDEETSSGKEKLYKTTPTGAKLPFSAMDADAMDEEM